MSLSNPRRLRAIRRGFVIVGGMPLPEWAQWLIIVVIQGMNNSRLRRILELKEIVYDRFSQHRRAVFQPPRI
jgi:hypothetical protein